jgi:hypothetical protein
MDRRMRVLVMTEVDRERQEAIENGLNKKLRNVVRYMITNTMTCSYPAATARVPYFKFFLGDVYCFEDIARPDSANCTRAYALMRSIAMYKRFVGIGYMLGLGSIENIGNSNGA